MTVHRFEVRPKPAAGDPRADRLAREAAALGLSLPGVRTARVYLIEGELREDQRRAIAQELLVNPVTELLADEQARPDVPASAVTLEVHPLPGVMDPAAGSVERAIEQALGVSVRASTAMRYDLEGLTAQQAKALAARVLYNPVIQDLHEGPWHPASLPKGTPYRFRLVTVPLRSLDDAGLERLSRQGHLFLSLEEMRAIQAHYQALGREPTDIELETLAQTWSEHCVHKTLKSAYRYRCPAGDDIRWQGRPGVTVHPDGSVTIDNLLKRTVAAATYELIAQGLDWALSVFHDNSGVIAFDDDFGVCIKVETHNHPSAIEPYGGAATGIGGCIRDIIGTGLAAKPIANTNVFCVAPPDTPSVPAGCIHPRRVLQEVVAGVRDYGNRMGIPTVNGAVDFDPRYVANPLVFAGCIGLIPRDRIAGKAQPGDRIIALGGRTGRDGIHGATFSSAELSDTHAQEFSHAVQIGNPIEEKKLLDAILRARDEHERPLFNAITDCGAGGFSSAVGEMGQDLGAQVQLDRAPLKYAGLSYTEIWISEAQERMVLAVPPDRLDALRAICRQEGVELADLGHFGTPDAELILRYHEHEVGRLPMAFVHGGIPRQTLEATWQPPADPRHAPNPQTDPQPNTQPDAADARAGGPQAQGLRDRLLAMLARPDVASKHWIIRQYDHEVQGNTVVKPLVGQPAQDGASRGPSDASVIEPVPGSGKGLAIACGLQTRLGDPRLGGDPYRMALAAVDECVRNLVCVGADPRRIAILDNFCWPGVQDAASLGHLVRAAVGCYDAAMAYRTPFVSGKDSLNNQFRAEDGTTIRIPPTLLITGIGIVHDLARCTTSDAKRPDDLLVLVDGSHDWHRLINGPKAALGVAQAIERGLVRAAHDASDGGVLVALAEMLIGGSTPSAPIGATLDHQALQALGPDPFAERPARYLLEIAARDLPAVQGLLEPVPCVVLASLNDSGRLTLGDQAADVEELARAWRQPLDW